MGFTLLVLSLLATLVLAQIILNPTQTLTNLYRSNVAGASVEERAMEYLLLSYPQLGNYTNVTMSRISRGSNRFSLKDVYFTLYSNDTRVSIIATISQAAPGEFISMSPLVTTIAGSNNISSAEWRNKDGSHFYIISGGQIKIINAGSQLQKMIIPGGFQTFVNSTDIRLDRAEALLSSLHPQMVNYSPQQVTYQIVSGINFYIQYAGKDGLTSASALVMVNLQMEPILLGFHIHCQQPNSSISITCTDDLAYQIFNACESFLLVYPQLLSYQMISMVSDDSDPGNGILFILTYQNTVLGTRALAELNILGNVFNVMSYYTYAYPKQ